MIQLRSMTFDDVGLGLRLKQENGWNQTPADWARFLALQPDGCFVAEDDGVACGTVTTCILGPVGWIGMMLVDKQHRSRGIGRALMTHALMFLDQRGIRTIRLDSFASAGNLLSANPFTEFSGARKNTGHPASRWIVR
jgi:GNAT superfamily N-acetyltransferase